MWFVPSHKTRRSLPVHRRAFSYRPRLEEMEDRCVPSGAGSLDTTFGGTGVVNTSLSGGNDVAYAVVIQPWDGKIVAGGYTTSGNFTKMGLARYNTDSSLDSSFGSGGIVASKIGTNLNKDAIAIYPATDTTGNAEKIVEAGAGSLARFNANGSVDTHFGNKGLVTVSATSNIFAVVVQADGKIVVGGDDKLVRYNPSGTLDTTFGSGGIVAMPGLASGGLVDGLILQPDGKLVAAGTTASNVWEVARFNTNGTLDTTFDSTGTLPGTVTFTYAAGVGGPSALAIYPSTGQDTADYGKIEVAGSIDGNPGGIWAYQVALARFNADGSTDSTFGQAGQVVTPFPTGGMSATATALQTDGKIVVAGNSVRSGGGQHGFGVLRYNTDGSLDTSFGSGGLVQTFNGTGDSWASGVAFQADGQIVAAGRTNGSTGWDFMVARYLGAATPAASLTSGSAITESTVELTLASISNLHALDSKSAGFAPAPAAGDSTPPAQSSPAPQATQAQLTAALDWHFAHLPPVDGTFSDPFALLL